MATNGTTTNLAPNIASALCYIPFVGWIAAIVLFIVEKNQEVRWNDHLGPVGTQLCAGSDHSFGTFGTDSNDCRISIESSLGSKELPRGNSSIAGIGKSG
jgi:hypothetical protein